MESLGKIVKGKLGYLVAGFGIVALGYILTTNRPPKPADPLKLSIPEYFPPWRSSNENPLTVQGVELGRLLFYDRSLSKDSSVSCASCHQQSLAFTDGRPRSVGMDGIKTDFGALSLANIGSVNHLTWEGHDKNLETQALRPIVRIQEMDQRLVVLAQRLQSSALYRKKFRAAFGKQEITAKLAAKAIAQFQRSLVSANSRYDQYLRGEIELTNLEMEGLQLFSTTPDPKKGIRGAGCISCHQGALFQGSQQGYEAFRNNGLYEKPWAGLIRETGYAGDLGKFRIPSLRNVEVTEPYMHLGNFRTLEEVINHYSEGIQVSSTVDSLVLRTNAQATTSKTGLHLTPLEKKAIIAFLKALTDKSFLNNPDYSNPFADRN